MDNVMNLELIRKGDALMALAFSRNPNLALPNYEEAKMIYEDVESKVVGIRFPVELLNWIDAFSREKAFKEGKRVTRNNVVIDALEAQRALELSKEQDTRPLPHFDPTPATTQHDELHALAKEITAIPPAALPLFEPALEERTPQASDAAADIDAFTADPNSEINGGTPRQEQHTRPATIRERDMRPRFELDAHPERERPMPVETVLSRSSMMQAIVAMLDAEPGLTGAEIARRLGQQGYRASNGAALNGANVLRDYRRWTAVEGEKE